jgi:hypothetical protein
MGHDRSLLFTLWNQDGKNFSTTRNDAVQSFTKEEAGSIRKPRKKKVLKVLEEPKEVYEPLPKEEPVVEVKKDLTPPIEFKTDNITNFVEPERKSIDENSHHWRERIQRYLANRRTTK